MKATTFDSILFIKSLTFVMYHSIAMDYWHFAISYCDKQNFFVCYCTLLSLGDISKYFAIVKQKVICQTLKTLNVQSEADIQRRPSQTSTLTPYKQASFPLANFLPPHPAYFFLLTHLTSFPPHQTSPSHSLVPSPSFAPK
jgi:hypothetical protein